MSPSLRSWVGVAALAALVSAGCRHTDVAQDEDSPGWADALAGGVAPASFQERPAVEASREVPPPRPKRERPAPPPPPDESAPAAELLPARHTAVDGGPVTIGRSDWDLAGQAPPRARPATLARPVSPARRPVSPEVELEPAVRHHPTPSAPPTYAHAADYSWLVGVLIPGAAPDSWAVRYAMPVEPDRHGGRLELVCQGTMTGFRPGQRVRVEGDLVDPAPLQIDPAYRVRAIQHLQAR